MAQICHIKLKVFQLKRYKFFASSQVYKIIPKKNYTEYHRLRIKKFNQKKKVMRAADKKYK